MKKIATLFICLVCLAGSDLRAQRRTDPSGLQPDEQALQAAAFQGDAAIVERLVGSGTRADATDAEGHTALMWAAFNGHTSVVRYLLDHDADLQLKDKSGRTPLMYACSGPHHETVQLLLDKGAVVNDQDKAERFTPLMFAASEGQLKVVVLLLEHGADPTIKDADGDTALSFARQHGHSSVVEALGKARAPADSP